MTGPVDSFHYIGPRGNLFMDYIQGLDAKDRKPYFDMLTKLRLGDTTGLKGLNQKGEAVRKGLMELSDGRGGHRIYGTMHEGQFVILGASGKQLSEQDKAIEAAVRAKSEFEDDVKQGRLDPKRHLKLTHHPALPDGHATADGKKTVHDFADRHGRPADAFKKTSLARGRSAIFAFATTALIGLAGLFNQQEALAQEPAATNAAPPAPATTAASPLKDNKHVKPAP